MDEMQASRAFQRLSPEILASWGFEKNLQQILIQQTFFYYYPQLVHRLVELSYFVSTLCPLRARFHFPLSSRNTGQ
jgi:hypothetical protein